MTYEAYRVIRRFGWNGWELAPKECAHDCSVGGGEQRGEDGELIVGTSCWNREQGNSRCMQKVGSNCICNKTMCRCQCGIPEGIYGGAIWIVEDGHPRKAAILGGMGRRFAVYDSSLDVEALMKHDVYKRLLEAPGALVS